MIQKSKRKYDCVSLLQHVNKKIDKLIDTNSKKMIVRQSTFLYANVKDHIFSYQWNKCFRNAILLWSLCKCLIIFIPIHTAAVKYFFYFVLLISLKRVTWDSSNAQVGLLHNITSIQFNVDSTLASWFI